MRCLDDQPQGLGGPVVFDGCASEPPLEDGDVAAGPDATKEWAIALVPRETVLSGSVSYTHLTLPTICSV